MAQCGKATPEVSFRETETHRDSPVVKFSTARMEHGTIKTSYNKRLQIRAWGSQSFAITYDNTRSKVQIRQLITMMSKLLEKKDRREAAVRKGNR